MRPTFFYLTCLSLCLSCNQIPKNHYEKPITQSISIFEIYLKDSVAVNHFSNFLRDTLQLPVEWEPFDIFGNNMVYDAAFFLGNTTLELLSVNPPDSTIREQARFNRILFHSKDIDSTSFTISKVGIEHQSPFGFNIASNNSELMIGRQINLDSLSNISNINIAFWEYLNTGYNFAERTIKSKTIEELKPKLEKALVLNPMGIKGLKEIHLSVTQSTIDQWNKLLGPSKANKWDLEKGPIISYTASTQNIGVDWIALSVLNLDDAKQFLSQKNLLSIEKNRVSINSSMIYGLKIYIQE